jgi:hypothetical protein
VTPLLAAALTACTPQPAPRTVIDFMDDGFAREGVLARCNESREQTVTDDECANARRAATAIALEAERARAPQLEQESEAKLLALRESDGRSAGSGAEGAPASAAPAYGAPIGSVLPSLQQATSFVYAEGADPLGRRSVEVPAVEPPTNDLIIPSPQLEVTDLAVMPRPFRDDIDL